MLGDDNASPSLRNGFRGIIYIFFPVSLILCSVFLEYLRVQQQIRTSVVSKCLDLNVFGIVHALTYFRHKNHLCHYIQFQKSKRKVKLLSILLWEALVVAVHSHVGKYLFND